MVFGRGRGALRLSCANQPSCHSGWKRHFHDAGLPIALDGAKKKRPEVGLIGQAGVARNNSAAQQHPTDIQVGSGM